MVLKTKASGNVLRLMTGTTIAQAIPVAVSPVLTRIYSPEDFGVYALFLAVMAVISSVISGRYELAIMLPAEEDDAFNIAALCLMIASAISLFLFLLILFFGYHISIALKTPSLQPWLYFLPPVVFFSALWNVLNYLNTRLQSYRDIAISQVYRSVTLATVQIVIGWLRAGVSGLIFGQVLSSLTANARMMKNLPSLNCLMKSISWNKIKSNAIRYIDFPKYTSWAALTNAVSGSMTQMLISVLYSIKTLGFYALTQRALSVPASLVSGAVGQVLLQRASQEKNQSGNVFPIFVKVFVLLTLISIPTFTLLYFVIEPLFVFVFGSAWGVAGEFARVLMPLFAIQFVVSPLTILNVVNEKNRLAMIANFILLTLSVATIYVCQYVGLGATEMLQTMVGVLSLYYLLYLVVVFKHVKQTSYRVLDAGVPVSTDVRRIL